MASMPAHAALYEVDQNNMSISFLVSILGLVTIKGEFSQLHGEWDLDLRHPEDSRDNVIVNANSVHANLDGITDILKSAAYFDTREFPELRFSTVNAELISGQHILIHGNLTIRNFTHPLTLDCDLVERHFDEKLKAEVAVFKLIGQLRRSDYGMVANPVLVPDVVNLLINVHIQLDPRENAP